MSTLNSISRSLSLFLSLDIQRVYEEGFGRRRKARSLNKTRANRLIRSLARANLVLDIIIFIWARHRARLTGILIMLGRRRGTRHSYASSPVYLFMRAFAPC